MTSTPHMFNPDLRAIVCNACNETITDIGEVTADGIDFCSEDCEQDYMRPVSIEPKEYRLDQAHQIKCLEVFVRFVRPGHQAVEIRRGHGDSRTQYLRVEQTSDRLSIQFCDKDGDVTGSINYNFLEVLEFTTSGYVR